MEVDLLGEGWRYRSYDRAGRRFKAPAPFTWGHEWVRTDLGDVLRGVEEEVGETVEGMGKRRGRRKSKARRKDWPIDPR